MTYEDLQKVRDQVKQSKQDLIAAEISYLEAQGCSMVTDQVAEVVRWKVPFEQGLWYGSSGSPDVRESAVHNARYREQFLRDQAEKQIAKLRAEHNIEG